MSSDNSSLLTLKSCCLCLPLRTGSIVIAVLSLVFSLIGIGFSIFQGVTGNTEGWVDLVIDVVHLLLASLLLQGIRTDQAGLVWAWVWGTGVLAIISIIVGVVIIVLTDSITAAILLFVISGLQLYFLLVVRAYAIQLTTSADGPEVTA